MKENSNQDMLAFIRRLTTAMATARLYDVQHPQVSFLCQQALDHLQQVFLEQPSLSLLLVDDQLVFTNAPLENDLMVSKLIRALKQRGIGHLKLRAGVSIEELRQLISTLTAPEKPGQEINSSENIRFGRVEVHSRQEQDENTRELFQQFPELAQIEAEELDRFMDLYQSVRAGKQLNVRGLSEIVGSFVNAFSEQSNPLMALAPLRNLDEYTYTHSTNVCILNIAQARMLGIEGQLLHDIGIAAMLHDIGKLFVSQEILQKPGQLEEREWQEMRKHPQLGAEYLVNTPGIPRLAVITAYEHHLRYNQSGYPQVPKGWKQHLCSQMTTISDFFDALRTNRAYRIGMDLNKIAAIMLEEAGTALHPLLTRNLLKAVQQLDQQGQFDLADQPN